MYCVCLSVCEWVYCDIMEKGLSCEWKDYCWAGAMTDIWWDQSHDGYVIGPVAWPALAQGSNAGREITSRQNLNQYLETLHVALTQFCNLPGFYRKTGFLRSHPLSLIHMTLMHSLFPFKVEGKTEEGGVGNLEFLPLMI